MALCQLPSQQPFFDQLFLAKTVTYEAVPSEVPNEEPKFAMISRFFSAVRIKPLTNFKLSEKKPPQNKKSQAGNGKSSSKTDLKTQRRFDDKKAAKQEASSGKNHNLAPIPAPQSTP